MGGTAYMAGKAGARHAQAEQQAPAYEEEPAPAPPAPARPAGGGLSPEAMEQLKSLAQLHDQGILTDQEFDQQKAKLLAG
ncbi:MAG: SHOCT domain-containing protein [Thermoleophilaceae bacterium]